MRENHEKLALTKKLKNSTRHKSILRMRISENHETRVIYSRALIFYAIFFNKLFYILYNKLFTIKNETRDCSDFWL